MISERRTLFAIAALGLALRVSAVIMFNHVPESDELAYQSMAQNLVEGKGIVDVAGNRAMYNIGYPLFVLAPIFKLFGYDLLIPRLVNCLLGVVTVLLCWGVAGEIGAGRAGRLLAAVFAALYLPFSVYAVYLFKENLMTPLMVAVVWLSVRVIRDPSLALRAVLGALLGLLALVGNAALVLLAPAIGGALLSKERAMSRVLGATLIVLVGAAVATPWVLRNVHAVGAPVLNTNGGFNLYLGNNPMATGEFVSIADTPRGQTWPSLRAQGEVFASSVLRADAVEWIKQNPGRFIELAVHKAVFFWKPPIHAGKGPGSMIENALRVGWAIEYLMLIALAISLVFWAEYRNAAVSILALSMVCYTGVHMIFYVAFRYREPVMPIVCVLAAAAAERLVAVWPRHWFTGAQRGTQ